MRAQGGVMRIFIPGLLALAACAHTAKEPAMSATSPKPTQPTSTAFLVPQPRTDLPAGSTYPLALTGDLHDFDYLAGAWSFVNQRLMARGVGSTDWDEFPARACTTIYLGSVVNVDEIEFPTKGWSGVTFRNFDLEKKQWSIYWVNSRTGKMFPPVVGGFTGNKGAFYGEDTDDGRPVLVRYSWTKLPPNGAHWEQAFSTDGGVTWETNWMMDLTRLDPSKCAAGRPVP
jgi:hypothetical protein